MLNIGQSLHQVVSNNLKIINDRNDRVDFAPSFIGIITTPLTLHMIRFGLYNVYIPALNMTHTDVPYIVHSIAENGTGQRFEPLGIGTKVRVVFHHTSAGGPIITSALASYGDISTLKTTDPDINPNGYQIQLGVAGSPYIHALQIADIKVNSKVSFAKAPLNDGRIPSSVVVSCTTTGTTMLVQPQRDTRCVGDQTSINLAPLRSNADQKRYESDVSEDGKKYLQRLFNAKPADFSGRIVRFEND